MNLNIVNFEDVRPDTDPDVPSTNYNTSFHSADEAPGLPVPSSTPYDIARWFPLILRSRGATDAALQTVSLSRAMVRVLVQAASASIHTKTLNRVYLEDLQEEVYPAFSNVQFPPEGLFIRFDSVSPKDGVQRKPGDASHHTVNDIVLKITTSMRAWGCLKKFLETNSAECLLFLLPFDAEMRSEREYRVFCAPESLRITAISQYRWHKPWMFAAKDREEMQRAAQAVLEGARDIQDMIVRQLHLPGTNNSDDLVRRQGFTFDVHFNEESRRCTLIELNPFGVRSNCGSCLFQWVRDKELLYGESSQVVEFRVTT